MPTNCGDFWFLCGPVFNLTSPLYWVATAISTAVIYAWGYRCGKADAAEKARSSGDLDKGHQ